LTLFITLSYRAYNNVDKKRSAVAKRPCDCCVGQFWPRYNLKRIFCTEPYRPKSIFNHCDVIGLVIYRIRWNY